ncbi:hypothetical protein JTB14_021785 [Gonioctena quinquepunctata]|nr:hypothetical protein JTB14_021785 [Gonioctena quinquepunctata]
MITMKVLLVLSIIVAVVEFSNSLIACPKDYCKTVKCTPVICNKETEIFVEKGGFCGCCDACYRKLYEGDRCITLAIGGGPFMARCVDGLKCGKNGTCVKSC